MSLRHLTAASAALVLMLAQTAQTAGAQPASAPAASAAPSAAAAPAAPTKASNADATEGKVAYYGRKFAGHKTASGERFNPNALTMAHKTLAMGTMVRVTNLKTQKSVVVRVNDRGPSTADRVGDVSQAAARKIRMLGSGVTDAKLEVVGMAKARKAHKAKTA